MVIAVHLNLKTVDGSSAKYSLNGRRRTPIVEDADTGKFRCRRVTDRSPNRRSSRWCNSEWRVQHDLRGISHGGNEAYLSRIGHCLARCQSMGKSKRYG